MYLDAMEQVLGTLPGYSKFKFSTSGSAGSGVTKLVPVTNLPVNVILVLGTVPS